MSSRRCSFKCICGIFLPLNPSTTTVYARSAFYPSLRFTLSLQFAFYTQSAFYPWSAVCSPQSAFYTDRFTNISTTDYNNKNCNEMVLKKMSLKSSSCLYYYVSLHVCKLNYKKKTTITLSTNYLSLLFQ